MKIYNFIKKYPAVILLAGLVMTYFFSNDWALPSLLLYAAIRIPVIRNWIETALNL